METRIQTLGVLTPAEVKAILADNARKADPVEVRALALQIGLLGPPAPTPLPQVTVTSTRPTLGQVAQQKPKANGKWSGVADF